MAPVITVPVAHADNDSFLAAVGDLTPKLNNNDPGLMLRVGKGACYLLGPNDASAIGIIPDRVADFVWQKHGRLERADAVRIVNAAKDNLCPGTGMFGYAS